MIFHPPPLTGGWGIYLVPKNVAFNFRKRALLLLSFGLLCTDPFMSALVPPKYSHMKGLPCRCRCQVANL